MSTGKRTLRPYQIITNGVMTGTSVITSIATNILNMDNIGFEIKWTGTPVGTLVINASGTGVNYYPLPGFSVNSPTGTAGGTFVDIDPTSALWLQLVYTNSSSTGVLNAWIFGKAD